MFVKVKFHGLLKKLCPDEYKVDVETAREAIRAVTLQLKDKLVRKDGNLFTIRVKECQNIDDLDKNLQTDELNLYPKLCMSGSFTGNNWVDIIIGAVIIILAVIFAPLTGGLSLWMCVGWLAIGVGSVMILQGIAGLMTPSVPDTSDSDRGKDSKAFGTSSNTTKIGTCIPIGYGKYKLAGQFLSVNLQAIDRGSESPLNEDGIFENFLSEPNKDWEYVNNRWVEVNG